MLKCVHLFCLERSVSLPSLFACVWLCSAALVGEGCEMRGVPLPSLFACVRLCSAALVGEGCEMRGVLMNECSSSSCADHLCRSSFSKHLYHTAKTTIKIPMNSYLRESWEFKGNQFLFLKTPHILFTTSRYSQHLSQYSHLIGVG